MPIDLFFAKDGPLRFLDRITPEHLWIAILLMVLALGFWMNFG
jgi:hypothetical protein